MMIIERTFCGHTISTTHAPEKLLVGKFGSGSLVKVAVGNDSNSVITHDDLLALLV